MRTAWDVSSDIWEALAERSDMEDEIVRLDNKLADLAVEGDELVHHDHCVRARIR